MSTPACTLRSRKINESDLPLSCPMPGEEVWNAHPRVYLSIEEAGHIICPYCSTQYELIRSS